MLLINPNDNLIYRIYIADAPADIESAAFACDIDGIIFANPTPDNTTTPVSVIVGISGGSHAQRLQITGTYQLTGGGSLVRPTAALVDASA